MRPKEQPDLNAEVQRRLKLKAEERESRAHAAAAALDECLTLLMLALRQAADTPRGMQARRARRLLTKFGQLRMAALEGQSPCDPTRKTLEVEDEVLAHSDRLVR
jgi:hypothetical protein